MRRPRVVNARGAIQKRKEGVAQLALSSHHSSGKVMVPLKFWETVPAGMETVPETVPEPVAPPSSPVPAVMVYVPLRMIIP